MALRGRFCIVIPAKAGIQFNQMRNAYRNVRTAQKWEWIPARRPE